MMRTNSFVSILLILAAALFSLVAAIYIKDRWLYFYEFGDSESYAVVIGDSIAEGHPWSHGRLHPQAGVVSGFVKESLHLLMPTSGNDRSYGVRKFDSDYKNSTGQISYHLERHLGMPVINNGIGAQTTVDVRKRWSRDVLAMRFDPGDGRGDVTAPKLGVLPKLIFLHVGINDIIKNVEEDVIIDNMEFFASSANKNGMRIVISNIGAYANSEVMNDRNVSKLFRINAWIKDSLAKRYNNVVFVDYLKWSTNGKGDPRFPYKPMFDDAVHPGRYGYMKYAEFIIKSMK